MRRYSGLGFMSLGLALLACKATAGFTDESRIAAASVQESADAPIGSQHSREAESRAVLAESDTAGLGAIVARHFPGYRLSGELDISRRFRVSATSFGPESIFPDFGTGQPWYIIRGDFDGDGREDFLLDIVAVGGASHMAVVIFAAGSAVQIGDGFSEFSGYRRMEKGAYFSPRCGSPQQALPADGIVAYVPEKPAAELFYWIGDIMHQTELICK
jgi:hypothetical protein